MGEMKALEEQIRKSKGYQIHQRLSYMVNVFAIYNRNYFRLRRLCRGFSTPEAIMPLWDEERREDLRMMLQELQTDLHNYLAALKTLIDHTRVVVNRAYSEQEFIKEYQARIETEFDKNPPARFLQDLRNYMLHYSLPAASSEVSVTKDQDTGEAVTQSRATIIKYELLSWPEWSSPSKEYLEGAGDEIDLLELIDAHESKIREFNDWLLKRLNAVHADELDRFYKMADQLQNLLEDT